MRVPAWSWVLGACLLVTAAAWSLPQALSPRAGAPEDSSRRDLEDLVTELREGGPGGAMGVYARAFAGYALVSAARAEPAYAPRAARLLDGLLPRLLDEGSAAPFHAGFAQVAGRRLSRSVAQRGHLALLLVGRRLLAPLPPAQEALLRALCRGLAAELQAAPQHLLPSHGRRLWPADNEVAAAALSLYQAGSADEAVAPGLSALQGALLRLEAAGLPPSEVGGPKGAGGDLPRGCALSWTVAMRGLYDPPRARALYERYRAAFFTGVSPVVGFREWPRGVDRAADADSGPIVLGIGTAASGIGIGAAALAGAEADHRALLLAARLAGMERLEGQRGAHALERAMARWARTARPWV